MFSQWILLGALLLVAVYLLKARQSPSHRAIRRLVILAVLVLGAIAVIFPWTTNLVAALVGVGRGADLVLYFFIVFVLFYIVHQYRRQIWQERIMTDLARSITLIQAQLEDQSPVARQRSGNTNQRPGR